MNAWVEWVSRKRFKKRFLSLTGFTLLELVIAIALSAVVLLSASNLLISFGRFSGNVIKSEASLMGTALGSFEEIINRIAVANQVTIPAVTPANSSIILRLDTKVPTGCVGTACHFTPSDFTDDTTYTYWLEEVLPSTTPPSYNLKRTGVAGDGTGTIIAGDIFSLSFTKVGTDENGIKVKLEARAASGPLNDKTKEYLEITVIVGSRSAN